ncbi:hypothetical protein ACHAQA_001486 [Verticillium albo-atrum]
MPPATKSHRRSKVKSGCRTCKIRKVKCDEGRPACTRCVTTGRVCDGYGVWGGGGNDYHERCVVDKTEALCVQIVSCPRASLPILVLNPEEKECFEWFKHRTSTKLPASYASGFWSTLVFQSSFQEPAVLNAAITLGSYHKKETCAIQDHQGKATNSSLTAPERFTLGHYVKAIHHLQPHFSSKSKASTRVALIACFLFVSFELLRGHFEAALVHLDNGLRILEDSRLIAPGVQDGARLDSTDDWIIAAFLRIQLQVGILQYTQVSSFRNLMSPKPDLPKYAFRSAHEAWEHLSPLLSNVMALAQRARTQATLESGEPRHPASMLEAQARLQRSLEQWMPRYTKFCESRSASLTPGERKGCLVPYAFHTMTTIMANTCLSRDESAYDSQTRHFITLLQHMTNLRKLSAAASPLAAPVVDMSHTIIDMGWIPPLYFTAVKCRNHRIRLQAVQLLESAFHREGVWDSRVATRIARKVMELEEQDIYRDLETSDRFPLCEPPDPDDLLLFFLPALQRLSTVEVVLAGAPLEKILLRCKWDNATTGKTPRVLEYSVRTHCWVDVQSN